MRDFLKNYLIPFAKEWSARDCLKMIDSPPPSVVSTTRRLQCRLSGVDVGEYPPGLPGIRDSREKEDTSAQKNEVLVDIQRGNDSFATIYGYQLASDSSIGPSEMRRDSIFAEMVRDRNGVWKHLFSSIVAEIEKGASETAIEEYRST